MNLNTWLDQFVVNYFNEHDGDTIFKFIVIVEQHQTEVDEDGHERHLNIPDEDYFTYQFSYLTRDDVIDLIKEDGYDLTEINFPEFEEVAIWNTGVLTSRYYEYNEYNKRATNYENIETEWCFDVTHKRMLSDVIQQACWFLNDFDLEDENAKFEYRCNSGYEYILDEVKEQLAGVHYGL